jgi:hypothetical protein
VLDYIEDWWTGDVERMERSLHPDLVKRIMVTREGTGRSLMNSFTKTDMIEYRTIARKMLRILQRGAILRESLATLTAGKVKLTYHPRRIQ